MSRIHNIQKLRSHRVIKDLKYIFLLKIFLKKKQQRMCIPFNLGIHIRQLSRKIIYIYTHKQKCSVFVLVLEKFGRVEHDEKLRNPTHPSHTSMRHRTSTSKVKSTTATNPGGSVALLFVCKKQSELPRLFHFITLTDF